MEEQTKSELKDLFKKEAQLDKEHEEKIEREQKETKEFLEKASKILNEIVEPKMKEFQKFLNSERKKCEVENKYDTLVFEYGNWDGYISFAIHQYNKKIVIDTRVPANVGNIIKQDFNLSEITGKFVEEKISEMISSHHKIKEEYSKKY